MRNTKVHAESQLWTKDCRLRTRQGASLIDVVVGVALIALIFWGIFGAFQLALELVFSTRAKVGALALANERMELIKSLSYDEVGTAGGIPAGSLEQLEGVTLNQVEYTRRTLIQFVDAPEDGEGAADENGITADYKRVKVEVTWNVRGDERAFFVVSNIVPRGIETIEGGGTLRGTVIDALGAPVSSASVRVQNDVTNPVIDVTTFTSANGTIVFPGSPAAGSYRVTVTKAGFSEAKTYDADAENPNPNPGHLTIVEGETTDATFAIDEVAQKTIRTFSGVSEESFTDPFDNETFVSALEGAQVSGGDVVLAQGVQGYLSSGTVESTTVSPTSLNEWRELSWQRTHPAQTGSTYQLLYEQSPDVWVPIPDVDLPGNGAGFNESPIDISNMSAALYDEVRIRGTLSTSDASSTPALHEWRLVYEVGPTPLPNISFAMRGTKVIGQDAGGAPIYKYEEQLSTDGSGDVVISDLEWDTYTIDIDEAALGLDAAEICEPQPHSIEPGEIVTTDLFLVPATFHSLLVDVRDNTENLISGASVQLTRLSFNETQITSTCGQTHFPSLAESGGTLYTLTVSASGFQTNAENNVNVSGPSRASVVLSPL